MERQFHRYYEQASKSSNIGLTLLQLLETRLDTVVYRAGFTLTQNQARQFVNHGHVMVNGKRASVPSFQVKPGDSITLTADLRTLIENQRSAAPELPVWLRRASSSVDVLSLPEREQITPLIDEQLIIEYYSR